MSAATSMVPPACGEQFFERESRKKDVRSIFQEDYAIAELVHDENENAPCVDVWQRRASRCMKDIDTNN